MINKKSNLLGEKSFNEGLRPVQISFNVEDIPKESWEGRAPDWSDSFVRLSVFASLRRINPAVTVSICVQEKDQLQYQEVP